MMSLIVSSLHTYSCKALCRFVALCCRHIAKEGWPNMENAVDYAALYHLLLLKL